MPKTLVTGATGFIGSHVARALVARGDAVRVTVRPRSNTEAIDDLDVERVTIHDITERRGLRRALRGVERVFHVAGSTNLRMRDDELFRINVEGTRAVLKECFLAGVERVVYTSSVAAIGPAPRGSTADESQVFRAGRLGLGYVNSKHEAETEAVRIAARGLPTVIVNPAHVLGRGDHLRSSTELVRNFLLRRLPAYTDGAINIVDVQDVAAGHLLADELGMPGERYILGNRNYTWERLFADLARISGVEAPAVRLPVAAAVALAQAAERMPGRPQVTVSEVRHAAQWWSFRNTKAKRDLGWQTAPHEETVEATIDWWSERLADELAGSGRRQPLPLRFAGGAIKVAGELAGRLRP